MARKYDQFDSPRLAATRFVAQRGLLKAVVWSNTRAPASSFAPASTASTAASSETMTWIRSASFTASAASATGMAPVSASAFARSGVRFHTRTS